MEIQTFDDLRRKIGAILGQSIPKKGFETVAHTVDAHGGLAHKQVINILVVMYNFLEYVSEHPNEKIVEKVITVEKPVYRERPTPTLDVASTISETKNIQPAE